jgi:ATP-binding cassette subfamily C protein
VAKLPLKGQLGGDGLLPLRDLDVIRSFVSGTGPLAFCDLPWIPLYVAICWAFHPFIGLAALGGALLLCALALLSEIKSTAAAKAAAVAASARMAQADGARRNAEVVQALGMGRRLVERWEERNDAYREAQQTAADITRDLGSLSKIARMALQSGVLALGAR